MARFFKFRTSDDIAAAAVRLGLDLRFQADLSPLFQPRLVGRFRVGNSLCIQPMEGCDGTPEGRPGELTYRRYERFGAGGAKLIWGEATAVVPEGRANPRQLVLTERGLPDFARLAETCRRAHVRTFGSDSDLLVGLQLTHSGRYSYERPLITVHDPLLDPRTRWGPDGATALDSSYPIVSDDELERLPDAYVSAARLAYRAGFQFVDIKQCHGYLLNELLAAKTRPGPFGGDLENRTRLARTIIGRIRSEVPELALASRLNVYDGVPYAASGPSGDGKPTAHSPGARTVWGSREDDPLVPDLEEPITWAGAMAQLGVVLVNVTMGNPYTSPHLLRPFEYPPPDGYDPPEHPLAGVDRHFRLAEQMQRACPELPMVGSGYSYLQEFLFQAGAANVEQGRIAFVGVGRASLPQPDFVRQILEHGRLERRRVCRTFSLCTALMRSKRHALGQFPSGCPPFDREVYGPIWEDARRQERREGAFGEVGQDGPGA